MPSTINGIGTQYYGKRNVSREVGLCEFCGNHVQLETYETGYYFVVLFIPLIPLGRKQILDYCPSCTQHRMLPVEEWHAIKAQAIDSSTAKLSEKMDDADAAVEHLQTLTAFKQFDEARDLATAIEGSHRRDVDIQFFLGAWHEKYGTETDADRCFDRAFEIDPDHAGAIRARGIGLIQKNQLDEARQLLRKLEPPSQDYDPTIFFMLAIAYQEKNDHQTALEIFDSIANETPEFSKQKYFRKAARKSEKMFGKTAAAQAQRRP
jgi:tetratricopeptide (TPR) repeat protein